MKSMFTTLLMLFCMSAYGHTYSIIERCVLEEYNGRQSHTPLVGVDVKVKGSNWTTTDVDGYFTLSFRYAPETITDFQFVKDGYVVFNKDAVAQWRISSGDSRFRVVLCKQNDLRDRIEQYWGVFEKKLNALYDEQLMEIDKLRLSVFEREEKLALLNKEHQKMSREYDELAQQYAYIDESECSEEYYRSLKLFKEGKIDESLEVFKKYKLGNKVDARLQNIAQHKSDLKKMLPMLVHESEIYRLNGTRDEDSLLVTLRRIVGVCKELNDTTNNVHLAKALYWLGKLHEPLVMDYVSSVLDGGNIDDVCNERENPYYAEQCFREAAAYGNIDAMYSLGRLYEYRGSVLYNLKDSRKWYDFASLNGHEGAVERMRDFYDFGVRMPEGCMLYFKILQDGKKGRNVKLTYLDQTYNSKVDNISKLTKIPSCVEYKSKKYYVKEIGRNALRVAFLSKLTIPEGVEVLYPSAFRSTIVDTLILPSSLRKIEVETVARFWPKHIEIDKANRNFYVDADGNVRRYVDDSLALELEMEDKEGVIDNSGVAFRIDESFKIPEKLIYENLCKPGYYYNSKASSCMFPTDRDTIPVRAMYYTAIKTLTIPENYKEIKEDAFFCDHYLYDVMIASQNIKMSKRSFGKSEFSDIYVFAKEPLQVDKATFDRGRIFRTVHVPKGSSRLYEKAKGWSRFSVYLEDMCDANPFYEALCLRRNGEFEAAQTKLLEVRDNLDPETPEFKMCNYHLAMMAYQTGHISELESMVKGMISYVDTVDVACQKDIEPYYLNLNLLACRMARQEEFASINVPEVVSRTLRYAIKRQQYDIISTFADEWENYLFEVDENSYETLDNANYYFDVLSCLKDADQINSTEHFVDSVGVSFNYEIIGITESLMERAWNIAKTKDSYNNQEALKVLKIAYVPDFFEIDRILDELDVVNKNFAESKVKSIHLNNMRLLGNIYIYSKAHEESSFEVLLPVDRLGDYVYDWLKNEINSKAVQEYMSDFCKHTKYEYTSLAEKIYETIEKIEHKVPFTPENEFSLDIYQAYVNSRDFYSLLDYMLDFVSTYPNLLEEVGYMCQKGLGTEKSYELAVRYFVQSYKLGNKDVLPTLADIYWKLKDFDNASKYLNLIDTPIKYYGLSLIYADWDMRHFDIYKSYDNLKKLSVIEGVDDGLRQRVEAKLEELAALANTMAYEEMIANNLEFALNYINLAIEIKPKEANFYDSKAEILYYFGETEKALEMWRKVIGMDPDFLDKYNSTVYYQLKRDCLIEL